MLILFKDNGFVVEIEELASLATLNQLKRSHSFYASIIFYNKAINNDWTTSCN